MFKKPFKVSHSNWLSNKDKKNLSRDLKKQFDSSVIELIMKTYERFSIEKFAGVKMLIYKTDAYPAFIDCSGKGEYFPTRGKVYVIAEFPELIQPLIINEGVERFILNGANLMWPGVLHHEVFKKDDFASIVTVDGSLVALGQMAQDSGHEKQGIAAFTLHWIGDCLWYYCSYYMKREYGPLEVKTPRLVGVQDIEEEQKQKIETIETIETVDNIEDNISDDDIPDDYDGRRKKSKNSKKKNELKKLPESADEEENKQQYPVEVMDQYIREAFLNSLKQGVEDKLLPMDASDFYSNYLLMNKRLGILIDLKKSSYKKIGKFFQCMHKEDFIEYKEAKKGQQPSILKINSNNPELLNWIPTVDARVIQKDVVQEKNYGLKPSILVVDLYRPKTQLNFLFHMEPRDKFYTRQEWKKLLLDYVQRECLRDKRLIRLTDPYLANLLSTHLKKSSDKTEEQFNDLITQEDLLEAFPKFLQKYHEITVVSTGKVELKAGDFKGIHLVAEKNHNRNVTKIAGLEQFGFDPLLKSDTNPHSFQCLSNYFQLKYACSVSQHDLPGKNQGREMVVHGNFLRELVEFFNVECSIDVRLIHTVNKLKPKQKPQLIK